MRRVLAILLSAAAGASCAPAVPERHAEATVNAAAPITAEAAAQQPATLVGRESDGDLGAHFERMKRVIRQDAATSYGEECGTIAIPDRAFVPVEISGGGLPELALFFGRVQCGAGASRFSGTGGVMVQFWIGSGGPVRLLLEHDMHGFTPVADGLVTMQHGGFCPGGAGPDQCRVTYRWNSGDRWLDVVDRKLASKLGRVPEMTFGYEAISR